MSEGGLLPPLILELRARAGEVTGELGKVKGEVRALDEETSGGLTKSQKAFTGLASVGKTALFGLAGGAALVGGEGLKMGIDFQEATTQLVTGAGESEKNIGKVRDGILSLAGKVGQTPIDLAHGLYLIESAGYHGAQGLGVLQAAAEGAKIGGADMTTVSDALTTALKDYHLPASQAADVTSKLIATVSQGKTTLGALSSSLSMVMPSAQAAGIGMNDVLGAMATMTAQGTDASRASTALRFAIASLTNPTTQSQKALASMGLNANDVINSLGKRGLTGTISWLNESAYENSKTMAEYNQKLSAVMGGARGLSAALQLSGNHAKEAAAATKAISNASAEADGSVKGWSETQKDLGTQIAQAKAQVEAIVTKIGMALIPIVEQAISVVSAIVNWFEKHTTVAKVLAGVIGGVLTISIAAYITKVAQARIKATADFLKMVSGWFGLGQASQTNAAVVASANDEIAASHDAAAAAAVTGAETTEAAEEGVAATSEATGAAVDTAFGPIGLAIAAVAAAATLLAGHWKAIWHGIEDVLKGAWNDVIRPVFDFIKDHWKLILGVITGGLSFLATNWRDIWHGIEDVYDHTIKPVFDFIKDHWKIVLGVITGGLSFLITNWSQIWGGIKAVADDTIKPMWDFIKGLFHGAVSAIHGALSGISRIWSDIWGGIKTAADDALAGVKAVVNDIISLINDAIQGINWVIDGVNTMDQKVSDLWTWTGLPGIPQIPHIPPIPHLAKGGIVTRPTLAMIGEGGSPEAVIPLPNGMRNFTGIPPAPQHGGARGGDRITVQVYLDGKPVTAAVERVQLQRGMRRGKSYPGYAR